MSVIETISMMSKSGYSDRELLEYIDKHYDEIECELVQNAEYLSTILFMCHHTIIRWNLREGNASARDMTILRSY